MDEKLLSRINELAKKKREKGLTQQEQEEQKKLYQIYLKQFRQGFKKRLDNIDVQTPDGNVTPLSQFNKNNKQ